MIQPADLLVRREPDRPTILVLPRDTPMLAVYVRLPIGARDEGPDDFGRTHLLEHILFKGTAKRGIGESAAAIEVLGGDINAWTSHDEVVLQASVAEGSLAQVLDVLIDMVRNARIHADDLEREKEVVIEEIEAIDSSASELLSERINASLWPDHPYGRPVIGSHESVRSQQAASLRRCLTNASTPAGLTIVLVGKVDPRDAITQIDALLPASVPVTRPTIPPAPPAASGIIHLEHDTEERLVQIAWRGPAPNHPDVHALNVLAAILGQGAGDRLSEALDLDPKTGFDAWSDFSVSELGTSFELGFRAIPGLTAKALARTAVLVTSFCAGARGRLVERARATLLADLDFAEQTVDSLADQLIYHETTLGDLAQLWEQRTALAKVTVDDVTRAARRWLRVEDAVVGLIDPELSHEDALAAWRTPPPVSAVCQLDAKTFHTTINGVPIWIEPAPLSIFAVQVRARGGANLASRRTLGVPNAWARMMSRGAGPFDAVAFSDELDEMSANLSASVGLTALTLSATAPSDHAHDLLSLLGDAVLDPHFAKDEWEVIQRELADELRTRDENAAERVAERLAALRYGAHPWALPADGNLRDLRSITPKALRAWHDLHMRAPHLGIAISGGVDPALAIEALAWLEDLPQATQQRSTVACPAWRGGNETIVAGHTTAIVERWLPGPGRNKSLHDQAIFRLALAILDGQSGRLFLDVREEHGLAYEVWARGALHADHGLMSLGATTRPSNVSQTEAAIERVIDELATRPPSPSELQRARAYTIGRLHRDAQSAEIRADRLISRMLENEDFATDASLAALHDVSPQEISAYFASAIAAPLLIVRAIPRDEATSA